VFRKSLRWWTYLAADRGKCPRVTEESREWPGRMARLWPGSRARWRSLARADPDSGQQPPSVALLDVTGSVGTVLRVPTPGVVGAGADGVRLRACPGDYHEAVMSSSGLGVLLLGSFCRRLEGGKLCLECAEDLAELRLIHRDASVVEVRARYRDVLDVLRACATESDCQAGNAGRDNGTEVR
jgi:hypothetical protein